MMTIALQSITSILLATVINIGGNVAIIQLCNNEPLPQWLSCAICGKQAAPSEVTAGLLDTNNRQQFACNGHFWNPRQFITGWADFLAAERAKRAMSQFALEYGEEQDARALR